MEIDIKTVKIVVRGRVQGVWYRVSAHQFASTLDVTGFVRNLEDHSVEIIATGESYEIEKLINWCHKGSPLSRVDDIVVTKQKAIVEFKDFSIQPSDQ